jgi:hypothetical protein
MSCLARAWTVVLASLVLLLCNCSEPKTVPQDGTAGDQRVTDSTPATPDAPPLADATLPDTRPPDAPWCNNNCDDGLECTRDTCTGPGTCTHTLLSSWCLISGVCQAAGARSPDR